MWFGKGNASTSPSSVLKRARSFFVSHCASVESSIRRGGRGVHQTTTCCSLGVVVYTLVTVKIYMLTCHSSSYMLICLSASVTSPPPLFPSSPVPVSAPLFDSSLRSRSCHSSPFRPPALDSPRCILCAPPFPFGANQENHQYDPQQYRESYGGQGASPRRRAGDERH